MHLSTQGGRRSFIHTHTQTIYGHRLILHLIYQHPIRTSDGRTDDTQTPRVMRGAPVLHVRLYPRILCICTSNISCVCVRKVCVNVFHARRTVQIESNERVLLCCPLWTYYCAYTHLYTTIFSTCILQLSWLRVLWGDRRDHHVCVCADHSHSPLNTFCGSDVKNRAHCLSKWTAIT